MSSRGPYTRDGFDGDFDALPLRAHILYGALPAHPLDGDFHHAASVAFHEDDVAADWRIEAIRWRRQNRGKPLDLGAIAIALSVRLYKLAVCA